MATEFVPSFNSGWFPGDTLFWNCFAGLAFIAGWCYTFLTGKQWIVCAFICARDAIGLI